MMAKKTSTTRPILLTEDDLHLFNEGSHTRLYRKLGSHLMRHAGEDGCCFGVWAPNAESVAVIGDFNGWRTDAAPMRRVGDSGLWEGFVAGVEHGARYKYHIRSRYNGYQVDKSDPFARYAEHAPGTASIVWQDGYEWGDGEWQEKRAAKNALDAPMSIYEVHVGSWMHDEQETWRALSYREMAPKLAEYVTRLGFTHVEFLPVMEHPFYGSWGYQTTGYFAPTSRFGAPEDFRYLVDYLHQHGIGVILDWVPSHFPGDEHGLVFFDGTHLYEHADPRQGYHPDWTSYIFNYGRNEVRSFLLSSAHFWLESCHADGLRVDAVASMLYLDYSRKAGEWIPNEFGGRENLEAISFLRRLNSDVYRDFPDTQTIAEESTAWPMVSRPLYVGGLGFGMKWDMGWMHDTLHYFQRDPIYRGYHHGNLTFRMMYAFTENFVLPLSHDEVVHGKGSLIGKMTGDEWQRFANLRLLLGYMWTQPGKKLLFMGCEFGQYREWNHDAALDWHLLEHPLHSGAQRWLADVNRLYRNEPAAHVLDFSHEGHEWIDANDSKDSVISYLRKGREGDRPLLVVCNFTPVTRSNYRVGVPDRGFWAEVLNSDAAAYGGSGVGNYGGMDTTPIPSHGRNHSLNLTLPPLSIIVLQHAPRDGNDSGMAKDAAGAEGAALSNRRAGTAGPGTAPDGE
jgi:1,4-alpha-glucan branching enzyme